MADTAADEDRELLRSWVQTSLKERGITATRAAREIGVATTTLTKFLNDPNYVFTPSTPVVAKLERLFGKPAPRSVLAGPIIPEVEASPLPEASITPAMSAALDALRDGRKSVEAWTVHSNALQAAGVLPGDIVLVDPNEVARAGDIVCAEVHDRGSRRVVFRLYEKPYLVAATFEARSWMPIVVDDRNVIVRGVVTDRLAKRRFS